MKCVYCEGKNFDEVDRGFDGVREDRWVVCVSCGATVNVREDAEPVWYENISKKGRTKNDKSSN